MRTPMPQIVCFVLFAVLTGGPWTSWYSASAQIVLPTELQGEYMMNKITMHFCAHGGSNCTMPSGDVWDICCGINSNPCYNETELSMCMEDDQLYYCRYRDAIVCQYEDGRGSCIYSISSSMSIQPLCVCKENSTWPVSDAQESQIRGSCLRNQETTTGLSPGIPTATSSMSDRTVAISSMSDQTVATSSMSDQTTDSNASRKSDSGEVNIIAIVLGTILVIVLLVFLAVCLVKRRRTQKPQKKVTTNPTNSSVVISAVSASLVPNEGEYDYAEVIPMDHKTVHDDATDHGYANVKSNQQQRGGPSGFVKRNHGPPRMPNLPAGSPSVEGGGRKAPKLPTKDSDEVYEIPDAKTTTKPTGVAAFRAVNDASNEGQPDEKKTIEHTYFERK